MPHGTTLRPGSQLPHGTFFPTGMFGRMFPALPPLAATDNQLVKLATAMTEFAPDDPIGDNPGIPAGFTYLGQFIDHDITLDLTPIGRANIDPMAVHNFRTPGPDLDCLYGLGPRVHPFMYQRGQDKDLFLIGETSATPGRGDPSVPVSQPFDLPRGPDGTALIGDPRNDENLVVAQTHLAFLRFHNKVVIQLKAGNLEPIVPGQASRFEAARQLVIWHYHWIVLHDFLRRLIQPSVLDEVLQGGRKFFIYDREPFIPVEFSGAAYRLGHSMVRATNDYNRVFTPKSGGVTPATLELLFLFSGGSGSVVPIPSDWIIDWRRFHEVDAPITPGKSRKLDPFVVPPLTDLPEFRNEPDKRLRSLTFRNLKRGVQLGLPSGQWVARQMGMTPLSAAELSTGRDGAAAMANGFRVQTPLWYYILKEAKVQEHGLRLGQVGSRILAEVFAGLIQGDPGSFLNIYPNWKPTLPSATPDDFTMADLLNFTGDVNPIGAEGANGPEPEVSNSARQW
ncbi:peroxidase family protein [Candidatus Entotheonella palauensis]|uniref:peroxidase family protein n=1 Tax=Candidatus Entotheonella palauensis TaxID=93172 RepID=UPI0015C489B4|nr:heme peroxidase family protein [Candidatus Entotheonella palauensis]